MPNPYGPPTTQPSGNPPTAKTTIQTKPVWPLYVFALLAAGAFITAGTWVRFALERMYNTANPVAEMTALSACIAIGIASVAAALLLHRQSLLFAGSRIRRIFQGTLVLVAASPCAMAVLILIDGLNEIIH